MALLACLGLLAEPAAPTAKVRRTHSLVALAAGSALMLHDWKDRSIWFEPGHGTQP